MKGFGGTVLLDLSKVLDTTRHGLPTAWMAQSKSKQTV